MREVLVIGGWFPLAADLAASGFSLGERMTFSWLSQKNLFLQIFTTQTGTLTETPPLGKFWLPVDTDQDFVHLKC